MTLNDLRVPVGAPVVVQLASVDVIHSFNLPNFRVKQDAVPGDDHPPQVRGADAGGVRHRLRPALRAEPLQDARRPHRARRPTRYQAWLRTVEADARRAYDPEDAEAHWGWDWRTR